MKLFRSDLETGFKNKLFETELKKSDNENIELDSNKLICELSSFTIKNGFRISGYILNNVIHECDRCLKIFCINNKISTDLLLSNHEDNNQLKNYEFLYLSLEDNYIDLKNTLLEILFIDIPFKNLCSENCEGICLDCGNNLNDKVCSCKKIR